MNQKNNFLSTDETSAETLTNNNNGWANFDAFENETSECISETVANNADDEWADFQSNTEHSSESADDKVQISAISPSSNNSLTTDQIESLISTCFPIESSTSSIESDGFHPFDLPTFTTCKDRTKQLTCLAASLSLWNVLANISNDPRGIQYQWRKSNTERYFHQSLGVHERFRTKINPLNSVNPPAVINVDHENKPSPHTVDPHFDWTHSGLENPLTVVDVSKSLDLDYYVPPAASTRKEATTTSSSPHTHRNHSPSVQHQTTPIKTTTLFPGSTTVLTDDPKPVVNPVANLTSINPKALMSSAQLLPNQRVDSRFFSSSSSHLIYL